MVGDQPLWRQELKGGVLLGGERDGSKEEPRSQPCALETALGKVGIATRGVPQGKSQVISMAWGIDGVFPGELF